MLTVVVAGGGVVTNILATASLSTWSQIGPFMLSGAAFVTGVQNVQRMLHCAPLQISTLHVKNIDSRHFY